MLVRHVRVPRRLPTHRPPERSRVTERRRNSALQHLPLRRTMPLPVYVPIPVESQRPLHVLARGVVGKFGVAGGEVGSTRRRGVREGEEEFRGVVGGEVEGFGGCEVDGGGGVWWCGVAWE